MYIQSGNVVGVKDVSYNHLRPAYVVAQEYVADGR